GLRTEAAQNLNKVRPATVGQAARISGVNPADISVLMIWLSSFRSGGPSDEDCGSRLPRRVRGGVSSLRRVLADRPGRRTAENRRLYQNRLRDIRKADRGIEKGESHRDTVVGRRRGTPYPRFSDPVSFP
ncbi:MAG: hypothetical protein IKN50_02265, partial [Clostridia bacterium]|nr:hypothetical protein [Clostridia bacterium]